MRSLIPILLTLTVHPLAAAASEPQPIYWWDVNAAKDDAGSVTIPEKISGADIIVPADNGVTLVDCDDGSGGKGLAFDGTQNKVCSSVSKLTVEPNALVSFKLKLSNAPRERAQTIFLGCGISIYAAKEGPLHFGVVSQGGPDGTARIEVVAPVSTGTWVALTASIKGSELELRVDDTSVTGSLPEGAVFSPKLDILRIGGDSSSGALIGEISDIKISPPIH